MSAFRCPHSRAGYRSAQDFAYPPLLLAGAVCASLSRRQNSWWKYRRSSPILLYSGLWSRTSTFQFLVVEGNKSVFKVFSQDSVQLRCMRPWNAVLSGLWSRSWILVCLVEVFQRLLRVLVNTLLKGFFGLFPGSKKSPKLGSHSGSELLPKSSPSTLSAHQMATDERTSMVDANGHAWVRLDTARGTFLAEPGHWASTVAPAMATLRCLRSSSSTTWCWRLSWSTSSCASLRKLLVLSVPLGCSRSSHLDKGALFS